MEKKLYTYLQEENVSCRHNHVFSIVAHVLDLNDLHELFTEKP